MIIKIRRIHYWIEEYDDDNDDDDFHNDDDDDDDDADDGDNDDACWDNICVITILCWCECNNNTIFFKEIVTAVVVALVVWQ